MGKEIIEKVRGVLKADSIQNQFTEALREDKGTFLSALIEIVGGDKRVQQCSPDSIVTSALKIATWKLPISRNFGFAWLIPRKEKGVLKCQAQLGYKGLIQLALRTGQYATLHCGIVRDGELDRVDRLTGEVVIGEYENPDGKVLGYFSYMRLKNGFEKTAFWTTEKVQLHAKRFSDSYGQGSGPWKTDFDAMAQKTVLSSMLSMYGPVSINQQEIQDSIHEDIRANIEIEPEPPKRPTQKKTNTEIINIATSSTQTKDPQATKPPEREAPAPVGDLEIGRAILDELQREDAVITEEPPNDLSTQQKRILNSYDRVLNESPLTITEQREKDADYRKRFGSPKNWKSQTIKDFEKDLQGA